MENISLSHGAMKHISSRKLSSSSSRKDLWHLARDGSLAELESALLLLKKNGGNIDSRNAFGLTPLHIATWRNNVPMVKKLLAAGADPNTRDGESGWSSLHRALHFGHLAIASVLLQFGASLTIEDAKYRNPVDLLSGPVLHSTGTRPDSVATEVFSWGSGTNYQLGTGNAHIQKLPCKVDALQGSYIKMIATAKFHSVAVGADGKLYTWGFGRGGRLGHPDFDIHSGQAAIITPRQVTMGLGSRRVKAVAVAKHHTVIATENGDVFTWGSNREGQLGYTSVDTQPIPRRVSFFKSRVIAVAAANKHTAAVVDNGEVFTWGSNKEGQLGYGTSNSASNYTPRVVEYLKGKLFTKIAAAKYHTIVLSTEGEVFTWGHRLVTPRRVLIARNLRKSGNTPMKFHRMERLHVVSVAAGVIHSTVLTDDGALFYWVSSDPDLRCQQLYPMCGRNIVSISAGKYWTSAVTDTGDVYLWDGKTQKGEAPISTRLHGIKRATSVYVGETHLLVICALYYPVYPPKLDVNSTSPLLEGGDKLEELDEDFMFSDIKSIRKAGVEYDRLGDKPIPSLKSLCEKTAIEFLVEPRNALQLLEIADSLESDELRRHCEEIAIRNLDFIFTVSAPAIASASLDILAKLEKSLDVRSSEAWSYRRLPTPTATFPAVIDVEDDGIDKDGYLRLRDKHVDPRLTYNGEARVENFLHPNDDTDLAVSKQVRALRKKLQQIEVLEIRQSNGHHLDDQQVAKLRTRSAVENALTELGFPVESQSKFSSFLISEGKVNKAEASRKQRKKNKQKEDHVVKFSAKDETVVEGDSVKSSPNIKILQIPNIKEEAEITEDDKNKIPEDSLLQSPKGIPKTSSSTDRTAKPTQSKKKNKKGGLSMFLSGALDDTPKDNPSPPIPKKEGPAWGGAKVSKGPTSLRDILDEQSKTKPSLPARFLKDYNEDSIQPESPSQQHIQLSSFLPGFISRPVAVVPVHAPPTPEGEKGTPPWSSVGTSPILSRPSLRDIQMQQEKKHNLSQSPKTRTMGFTVSSGQGLPSEPAGRLKDTVPNRWFKPEMETPSSIRSIQIEEKAMKDLKRIYSHVSFATRLWDDVDVEWIDGRFWRSFRVSNSSTALYQFRSRSISPLDYLVGEE